MLQYCDIDLPLCLISDFNVISSTQDKLGGRAYNLNKCFDFFSFIKCCGLLDIGYNGHPYTWCNHRNDGARILKRLDTA